MSCLNSLSDTQSSSISAALSVSRAIPRADGNQLTTNSCKSDAGCAEAENWKRYDMRNGGVREWKRYNLRNGGVREWKRYNMKDGGVRYWKKGEETTIIESEASEADD